VSRLSFCEAKRRPKRTEFSLHHAFCVRSCSNEPKKPAWQKSKSAVHQQRTSGLGILRSTKADGTDHERGRTDHDCRPADLYAPELAPRYGAKRSSRRILIALRLFFHRCEPFHHSDQSRKTPATLDGSGSISSVLRAFLLPVGRPGNPPPCIWPFAIAADRHC